MKLFDVEKYLGLVDWSVDWALLPVHLLNPADFKQITGDQELKRIYGLLVHFPPEPSVFNCILENLKVCSQMLFTSL